MKQTAVLFLQEALSIHFTHEQKMQFIGLFNQALEMEKQQIMDATCFSEYINDDKELAEIYYNEVYNSKQ
jgi:hypothetical protein